MARVDTELLYNELVLIAVNDGDAYRDGKNAERAVDNAIRDARRTMNEAFREEVRDMRKNVIKEVRKQWRDANPSKSMVVPNPSGKAVAAIHVVGKHTPSGNPQRLFMVISDDGRVIDVIEEGDEGKSAVTETYGRIPLIPIRLQQKEYKEILRDWSRTQDRAANPAFSINESIRASIGAAIGGALGGIGGPWTAAVWAAIGSLIGSNWKKLMAGAKAGTSAYRSTARANNPGPMPSAAELVGRLKF